MTAATITTPATGTVLPVHRIGGADYALMKLVYGDADTATLPTALVGLPVGLDAASLAALETVSIAGAVALDAGTLAALENITVTGTVALDAPSLAALENVTVAGIVALDAPTLAALESTTVSGSVALDAPTLAALENITVTASTPTPFTLNSAASTNLTVIKASAGSLFHIAISNIGAAVAYVKLYNKATAPVLATDIPLLTLPIAAKTFDGLNLDLRGHVFSAGIAMAITNLEGDTDTTAVAASQIKVIASYA